MEVTIDGTQVDMDGRKLPTFTYAISDPMTPGSVAGTRATTWRFPATNAVRALLGGPTMNERPISADPVARVQQGGNVYVKHNVRPVAWSQDEIEAVSVGNNGSWMSDLKGMKLPEMDLGISETITAAYQQQTWTDEDDILYFPLIDYGFGWIGAVSANPEHLRPALRCHRVLKKAFNDLGYTLKIKGTLNNVWKKFVLPCVVDIEISEDFLTQNAMTLEEAGNQNTTVFNGDPPKPLPPVVTGVIDPGGNNTNTFFYTAPLDMRVRADFSITINVQNGLGNLSYFLYDTATNAILTPPMTMFVSPSMGDIIIYLSSLGEVDLTAGQEVGVGVTCLAFGSPAFIQFEVQSFQYIITPIDLDYQPNVTVDIAGCAPKLSAWDVLAGINYVRCLSIDTDDRTKVVTVSYYHDKYRHTTEGRSMVGREDHTDLPRKEDPLKCKRIDFRWKEDDNDVQLSDINEANGERGWGGFIYPVDRGTLKEKAVEMPFAATTMYLYPGNIFIPALRETYLSGVEETTFSGWVPRILLSDGLARGAWTYDGTLLDQYPKCFFVFPGETDLSMSFYPETWFGSCGPGMVATHWADYLRRFSQSKILSIDLMLYDDELQSLDFGIPVEVNDGYGSGWYYFTEIRQKRYGVDEPTRTELIQV